MADEGKQVTLITGCSTGIGRALSIELAEKGHTVYASARKVETLADLEKKGCRTLSLDVTDAQSISDAVRLINNEAGRIDLLINNAGFGLMGPVAEISLYDLRKQLETNVVGPIALAQAVIPYMIKNETGCIVNVGSVSGIMATPFAGAYCASKAALHMLTDSMRIELAPFGIKVICIQPGGVQSSFGDNASTSANDFQTDGSIYSQLADDIEKRARTGQEGAMPAEDFAREVVNAILRSDPDPVIRLGRRSTLLPALKTFLSNRRLDKILSKKFGLSRLGANRPSGDKQK